MVLIILLKAFGKDFGSDGKSFLVLSASSPLHEQSTAIFGHGLWK